MEIDNSIGSITGFDLAIVVKSGLKDINIVNEAMSFLYIRGNNSYDEELIKIWQETIAS
ncbi:16625_t:CDS:2 [Dentiscutata erythropus]|uniref:16625_t:CDS:1 n=1 Tax=Dentiscutata erythropus TaxID=1348616 RepID=A0A9N9GGH7_9GLOM|nr:16625_t:CDS:2 [Dentiscutata erythropus]